MRYRRSNKVLAKRLSKYYRLSWCNNLLAVSCLRTSDPFQWLVCHVVFRAKAIDELQRPKGKTLTCAQAVQSRVKNSPWGGLMVCKMWLLAL